MTTPTALTATAAALEGAAGLRGADWDDLDGPDVLEAAVRLGRLKALVDGALVAVAERLEDTGAADAVGWASAKDFLTQVTGGRKGAGGGLVRVAQRTAELPAVRAALAAGEISLAQAGVISNRVAALPRDPELRETVARALLGLVEEHHYDATDLDRCVTGVVKELDVDGLLVGTDLSKDHQERGAHGARYLSFSPDTLGGVRIKGYATLEEAELVKTCLMPLAAPVVTEPGACGGDPATFGHRDEQGRRIGRGCPQPGCSHTGRDPRDHGVRMWDALVEACRRLQATDHLPHAHGTTARITVTMGLDDLTSSLDAEGLLPSGDTLSAATVRRLACDAEIIPAVLGTEGQVLDVARASRLVTIGIWNALVLRDRHCAFPGCTRLPIACDAHHIQHWADAGSTSLENLVLLCRRHHTLIHRTPWRVDIDPGTRRPVWIPPPPVDDSGRFSYSPARPKPPPLVA
ncbi:HNH endonuclease signature motif containing protein [Nocardioides bizhenqiangii]|uniref:DUF222 domain-containing protein n=1 Tax=Nocardioides bizhenqiangii TaxID=3095076 RepID=A0ABZ0ZPM9_9ACTN|nr:DUF222 domain-containing protein [Nocardioides sp. HM61]WQQ25774.1 DUF222 domain-containing protein [Nocardioides sp. HM61]